MIDALGAFRAAVAACDPTARVAATAPRATIGIAIGKAALAMARGATVDRGIVVSPVAGDVPNWRVIESAHPIPDERSVAAARAVRELVDSATPDDLVLGLISGGASALIEAPLVPLPDFVARIGAAMDAGVAIEELNRLRISLSAIKGGKLVAHCKAPVVTLVISDVVGDPIDLIGSAPTIDRTRSQDRAELILPMRAFAEAVAHATQLPLVETPYTGDVADVAAGLQPPCVAWGEPTLHVPADHGEGGRSQQLALLLAKRFRGTPHTAFVAGSDGIDGPPPRTRPAPAGAAIDGTTWDAIVTAGIDPDRALARRDAGTALAAVGALVITGPTGVNHADVAILT